MAVKDQYALVQKLYVAFYQRPADPAGLQYWAQQIDTAGGNQTQAIKAFATSAESTALYGAITSANIDAVVTNIYQALFGVAPDAAGKKFYVDGFNAGTFNAGTIALNVLNGAQNADLVSINNKLTVANSFTAQVDGRALSDANFGTGTTFAVTYDSNDIAKAKAVLTGVTTTALTDAQVKTYLQTNIANTGDPILVVPPQSFTLTANVETVTGGDGNDTITGVISALTSENTLNDTDVIDAGKGTDIINLAVRGNFAGFTGAGKLAGVETVNLNSDSVIARTFTATGVSGVTTYNIDATKGAINLDKLADLAAAVNVSNQATGTFTVGYGTDVTKGTTDKQALGFSKVGTVDDPATTTVNEEVAVGVTIAGVEEINATVTGDNVIAFTAAETKTLTAAGAGSLKLTAVPAGLKALDASKVTGKVVVDLAAATGVTTVATGSADDTITANVGDDLTANAVITGGTGNDILSLNGAGTVQYVLSGVETISLKGLTGGLTYSGSNTKDVTTLVADKAMGGQTATFANMGTGNLTVEARGANAAASVINSDHAGSTTINVNTPASTATAATPDTNAVAVGLTKSTSVALNVAEKMDYQGVVTASKATNVNVTIDGQTSGAAEVNAAAASSIAITKVANNSALKLTAVAAKDLSVTATKDFTVSNNSNLSAIESLTINSATLTTLANTNLAKVAAVNLSGTGSVDLDDLGSATLDYGITLNATGLSSNKATNNNVSLDVGAINTKGNAVTVNAAGVLGKVNVGAINASNGAATGGNVTVNLNGTGGASTLGAITGKNVSIDATGALGAVTYAANSITTESGGVVNVKGATLSATTIKVVTGGASAADNTISFTGGIAADTFTVATAANFDKKIASLTVTGGIEPANSVDKLVLDATAADLTVTSLNIDGIENITVTNGNNNKAVTVNAAGVSGKTFAVDTGILTVQGTIAAETIDTSKITVANNGSLVINPLGGNDTIKLGAVKETVVFAATAATNGVDAITGFTFGNGNDVLSFASFIAAQKAEFLAKTLAGSTDASGKNVLELTDVQTLTAANFGAAASATVIKTTANQKLVVFADVNNDADTVENIYFVTTDANNVATVTLVGTINEGTLDATNLLTA